MENIIKQLAKWVFESKKTCFFGGAGISTESGIPDFRSAQGIYHQNRAISPETILSRSFFMKNPEAFYDFYRKNLIYPNAKPNQAHIILSELEKIGKLDCVITQNIDGLHQAAGSKMVLELHGTIMQNYCMDCGHEYPLDFIKEATGLPLCACGHLVKPDVVLYEEGLDMNITQAAVSEISASDVLIIGGTSLSVYPAAAYAQMAKGKTIIINKDSTQYDAKADLVLHTSLGAAMKELKEALVTDYGLPL